MIWGLLWASAGRERERERARERESVRERDLDTESGRTHDWDDSSYPCCHLPLPCPTPREGGAVPAAGGWLLGPCRLLFLWEPHDLGAGQESWHVPVCPL